MCPFSCGRNKSKEILIEFYKDSEEKLIKQLENYLYETYKKNIKIINNNIGINYSFIIFEDENNKEIIIKYKIIKNKFNYKMEIYEIIYKLNN
jgi:hypothetical protein